MNILRIKLQRPRCPICNPPTSVQSVQFHKREDNHGVVLLVVKPVTLLKVTLLHGSFSRF